MKFFRFNKKEYQLSQLKTELYNHFKYSNKYSYYRSGGPYAITFEHSLLKPIQSGSYLIFNDQLCLIIRGGSVYHISIFLNEPIIYFFKNSTVDFVKAIFRQFDQLVVRRKGPPYSNCSESKSKIRCLNECFKRSYRLSRYFYDFNETGFIKLNSPMNRSIEESEKSCFDECWKEGCEIAQFIPIPVGENRGQIATILEAQPKLDTFDFWIQFIGLVCSFANISLNQFISLVIKYASSKVKRRKVRIGLFCLKWAVLFLSLLFCGGLYTHMIFDHRAEKGAPNKKEIARNFIKQNVTNLVICIDIKKYLNSPSNPFFGVRDLRRLNKTVIEIEKATDRTLDDHLKGISLNYQQRIFRVSYTIEPKVVFKYTDLGGFGFDYALCRCFFIAIRPNYEIMPSNPKLTIKLKVNYFNVKLYLLTKNENLNENTFAIDRKMAFKKRIVKRLESSGNCMNYQEKYSNCTSRLHCVESCINKKMFKKFENITLDTVSKFAIDKDQFSQKDWNNAYLIPFSADSLKIYKNISQQCLKEIPDKPPCLEIKFKKTIEVTEPDQQTMEIDLFPDVDLSLEEFNWFNLLLKILNVQSIFFGITVLKLLRVLYNFIRLRVRNGKSVLYFIYLLCSIGFVLHTFLVVDLSINGELIFNPNFEIAKRVQMPVLVFCHKTDKIDKNFKLTGNYLWQLTKQMGSESIFTNMAYLNESNEWASFDLNLIELFFFMHLRCFRIKIDQVYDTSHAYFSTSSQTLKVLKVKFALRDINLNPGTNTKTVYFMTKGNETAEFSNIVELHFDLNNYRKQTYLADQSEISIKYEAPFSFIKRLLSKPNEDEFSDLDGQVPELKSSEYHFGNLKNPLEKENFGHEIHDDLFDQFVTQVHNATSQDTMAYSDYQQLFFANNLIRAQINSNQDFAFSLVFIKKTLLAKNDENFAKLVLNLLNVLFLWFDLGILDLHPIFMLSHDYLLVYLYLHWPVYLLTKITQFMFFSHRWLKKFEQPLYQRLDSGQQKSKKPRRLQSSP